MVEYTQEIRKKHLLNGLMLDKPGLEVSPLFRPTVVKQECSVYYTDYTSAEDSRQKHSGYEHDEIVDIDFIWRPGKRLSDCIRGDKKFQWALASHVLEHVPNPVGWISQVLDTLEVGGIFSLALPDKRFCFDVFRRETEVSDLIDLWIREQSIPSPLQIYDFLSHSIDGSGDDGNKSFDTEKPFEGASRVYTDKQALEFVIHAWMNNAYLDAHCSVFTPESFVRVFTKLVELGILNVSITEPVIGQGEFFVKLIKKGEPVTRHPEHLTKRTVLYVNGEEVIYVKKGSIAAKLLRSLPRWARGMVST